MLLGLFVLGEAQRTAQNLPVTSRQFDETKQELARLKAEVERLTKFIKVTDSAIHIEAPSIYFDGKIYLNYNNYGLVRVYTNTFFYGTVYGRSSYFTVF